MKTSVTGRRDDSNCPPTSYDQLLTARPGGRIHGAKKTHMRLNDSTMRTHVLGRQPSYNIIRDIMIKFTRYQLGALKAQDVRREGHRPLECLGNFREIFAGFSISINVISKIAYKNTISVYWFQTSIFETVLRTKPFVFEGAFPCGVRKTISRASISLASFANIKETSS